MLKRLCIVLLALALVASVTMQLIPRALAAADDHAGAPCDMMNMMVDQTPRGELDLPCKGVISVCNDSICCAFVVDLSPAPRAELADIQWTLVVWSAVQSRLSGLPIEPELSPPIAIA
jgi:hypothetical protein